MTKESWINRPNKGITTNTMRTNDMTKTVAINLNLPSSMSIDIEAASSEHVEVTLDNVDLVVLLDSIFNQLNANDVDDIMDRCWTKYPQLVSIWLNELAEV